jgi:hypothetical protein
MMIIISHYNQQNVDFAAVTAVVVVVVFGES